jgi:nickel-dependent lactate racemase
MVKGGGKVNPALNPWPRPKLMLLDSEPCEYPVGVIITAYQVVDGAGNQVTGCNSRAEAEQIRNRYADQYPKQTFYIT